MMLPAPLLESLQGMPGYEETAFLQAHQQVPPVSVRLHPLKGEGLFSGKDPVLWEPMGRYLESRPVFALDPLWHAGAYYVQEASSMLTGWAAKQLFPDPSGIRVLDLCAAPGGKSTHLASWLPEDALLLSNEVIRSRAGILTENGTRWGYPNHWVSANDPAAFGNLPAFFDLVVVDAPCSGSGLFRKDPDAREEWSEDAVALCAARQERILHDVWPTLRPGGVLLYATCSYSPQEDEKLLDRFLETVDAEPILLPVPAAWGVVPTVSPKKKAPGLRCFPHLVKGEGFYLAAIRKMGQEERKGTKEVRFRSQHDAKAASAVGPYLKEANWAILLLEKNFLAIPAALELDYALLRKYLYLRSAGIFLGMPAGKDWIPEHSLAMSVSLSEEVSRVALTEEQALRYLRREDPEIGGALTGWQLATFEGRALGWMKAVKGRVNNYLPKQLRLRM